MTAEQVGQAAPWDEFELIEKVFAPLARNLAGAFGLKDDVAALAPPAGHELVLKTDSTIESVHFLHDDPPDTVAQKALRRALSDIAAKASTPAVYLLAIALPAGVSRAWIESFAQGLAADQTRYGIALAGGETSRTPGPLSITVTAIGWVREGRLLRRSGAELGHDVWMTGTIGDAEAGLGILKGEAVLEDAAARDFLVRRFRIPEPRLQFGSALGGMASAAIDISDGLIADLGHIAEVSAVKIQVELDRIVLSSQLRALWGTSQKTVLRAASGGDDYEIGFTASVDARDAIVAAAKQTRTQVTRIGSVVEGAGEVALTDSSGRAISSEREGYRHF